MLTQKTLNNILNSFPETKSNLICSQKEKTTKDIYIKTAGLVFSQLSPVLYNYIKDNNVRISFPSKEEAKIRPKPEEFADAVSYGYLYLDTREIYIVKPEGVPDIEKISLIVEHLAHEIGHLVFIYILGISYNSQELSLLLFDFFAATDKEGGFTPHAEKYVKEIYGVLLRQAGKEKIFSVDIKYHENFAEIFSLFIQYQISSRNNKIDIDTNKHKWENTKKTRTLEIFNKIMEKVG